MESISIKLDGTSLINTMMVAYVERLKRRGATHDETLSLCSRASGMMASQSESVMEQCAKSIAAMVAAGHDQRNAISHANVTFAIAGVELADELYKSLAAERN